MGHEKLETTPERSRLMSRIRSKNTAPELLLKDALEAECFVYQPKDIPHSPDFGSWEYPKTAIFIDGCFWHSCPWHYKEPKTNTEYWQAKSRRNKRNDCKSEEELTKEGWLVIRIWEHSINQKSVKYLVSAILKLLMAHDATNEKMKVVRI